MLLSQVTEFLLTHKHTGQIPILIDNAQSPPFVVMESSATLLYLLKLADKDDVFGFKDELEYSQCLQWLFFWHGSGAPYQYEFIHFNRFAQEKDPCTLAPSPSPFSAPLLSS